MRAALNEEVRGPASTNVPCPPQTGPWGGPLASERELDCAGFDFLPVSAYHELSFCSIQLRQFDNVGQNRMHTFAGEDGSRRTVAILRTDAFDDEDTQLLATHSKLITQARRSTGCSTARRPIPDMCLRVKV